MALTEFQVDVILADQAVWIDERFPKSEVNMGWVIDMADGEIASKIYGHGILTSWINRETNTVEHHFAPR